MLQVVHNLPDLDLNPSPSYLPFLGWPLETPGYNNLLPVYHHMLLQQGPMMLCFEPNILWEMEPLYLTCMFSQHLGLSRA